MTDSQFPFNSRIICKPTALSDVLNIPKDLSELDFEINNNQFVIRNHICHEQQDVETVRLKYQLQPAEFATYDVKQDVCLIFSLKDFASVLEFAGTSNNEITIEFTQNSSPLIISFDNDEFVKVKMVMSTMEERNLKSFNKPSVATSYKALIGSYIENRHSISSIEAPSVDLSESEMRKNLSPRISSFVLNSIEMQKTNKQAKTNGNQMTHGNKRKSTETVPEVVNKEQAKRQKIVDDLSENIAASKFLEDLDAMDAQSVNEIDFLPEQNSHNVQAAEKPHNSIFGDESDQLAESCRFDVDRANFSTEDQVLFDVARAPPPRRKTFSILLVDDKQQPINAQKLVSDERKIAQRKIRADALLFPFEPILNPRRFEGGTVIVPNSDSSDSEGQA